MTTTPRARVRRTLATGASALVLILAAGCGSDTSDASDAADPSGQASTSAGTDYPVTVLSGPLEGGTELTIEQAPERIVSLSPTATETLWAIGAGDRVVAVDDQSDYPEDVPTTDLSGYQPNVEAVLAYEPDLVVSADDTNNLVAGLEAAGVPTLLLPAATDLDEAYSQWERLGAATGQVAEAAALVADVQTKVEEATSAVPDAEGLTYFHELDPTLYTVTGETFIGQLYAEFGLTSIADAASTGDDYPQLSSEYVVEADPDLIVLTDTEYGDVTVENVAKRAGWAQMQAVKNGNVVELDPDIASRWGPRVAEFAELIADQVAELDRVG